jgi:hypothetical protein
MYPPAFDGPPLVHLRLAGLGFSAKGGARVTVEATQVTALGFKLRVDTWDETELQDLTVGWTALPRPLGYPPQEAAPVQAKATQFVGTLNSPGFAKPSCKQILLDGASLGNGYYWVVVLGERARVFCDMTGGGLGQGREHSQGILRARLAPCR